MMNVRKNTKAVAMPMIAILIILILVIAGAFIVMNPEIASGSTEYWETENEFGMWQETIIIKFKDGSTESLKIIEENWGTMAVYINDKEVSNVEYDVDAKVTGKGYDGAEIYINDFEVKLEVKKYTSIEWDDIAYGTSSPIKVELDKTESIFNAEIPIESISEELTNGIYILKWTPSGIIEYTGYPDGENLKSASLPKSKSVPVLVKKGSTGEIEVTLYSEIVVS